MVGKFYLVVGNACTLVPTIFRWHGKREFKWNFHFSFSHDIEKQIWVLLFVFRFRPTLKNGFELRIFRFSFSQNFEKRLWISVFVFRLIFASLWKTDMTFAFRSSFSHYFESGFEFRFSFSHHFDKQIWISFVIFAWLEKQITAPGQSFEAPATPSGLTGAFMNFPLPGDKVSSKLPPSPSPMICLTHTRYSLFQQWMTNDMMIAAKKHAAITTLAYPRWRRKMTNIWTLYNLKSQNAR